MDEQLSGRDNLRLIAGLLGARRQEAAARADELLEAFELSGAAGRPASTYSGGMRRRLDLAASLVGSPEVIFLDEPTTGLDPQARLAVWDTIAELTSEGTTVLLTTQYLDEADRLAAAQAATQKLVFEAEQRASTAEERAAKANAQADQTRRDADQHARQLVGNAEKNADRIAGQAKAQAEQLLTEVNDDAERRRAASNREVDDLIRQKDSIASHLAQLRQLLPGMDAVQAAQTNLP